MAAAAAPAPAPVASLARDNSQLFGAFVTARHGSSFAATPEHLLVFGGTMEGDDTCYLHSFDFSRRLWTEFPLCEQLAGVSSIQSALSMFSPDGTLYIFGGETYNDFGTTEDVELSLAFDLPAGAWRVVQFSGELPSCTNNEVAVVGNKAFVVSSNTGAGHVHVLDFASLCFSRMQTTGLKPEPSNIRCLAADASKKLVYALVVDMPQCQLLTLDTETLTWAAAALPFRQQPALELLVVLPDGRVLMTDCDCTDAVLYNCSSGVASHVDGPLNSTLLSYDHLCARQSSLFMFSGILSDDPTCPGMPMVEVALASLVPAAGGVPPPSKLVADLGSLLEPDGATLSDVTFLVEGKEVKAHRCAR